MRRSLVAIWALGLKELASLRRDIVLVLLIVWAFSGSVYSVATGLNMDVVNAAVGIVDADRSALSHRLRDALQPPLFQPPADLAAEEVQAAFDTGRFTFIVEIPPGFEADLLRGRRPQIQLSVDATAMNIAGIGTMDIQIIVQQEVAAYLAARGVTLAGEQVSAVARVMFNPNLEGVRTVAIMEILQNITVLAIILVGAAVIREREHGTIEHLLVMPVRPTDIVLAKIWANGCVILLAVWLSLEVVIRRLLAVPVDGSVALFLLGTAIYLFAATSLGILLATIARSMPQFGLLAIPLFIALNLLSGATTPLDSMPEALVQVMQFSPTTQFIAASQAILYRAAGLEAVIGQFLAVAAIGGLFLTLALARFRAMLTAQG
ncbi:ABC transporter permease [Phenylobacterium sp.]|uniref:ABC transporter permease n=1 Tax=Phenylobacterium sp. TaxID=1871053 RepID=UPI002FDD7901